MNLAGARGVLVNITASRPSLKLRETKEVMNIVRTFAAEDATIIYGGVYDDSLADSLRVTVVATARPELGAAAAKPHWWSAENRDRQRPGAGGLPPARAGAGGDPA